MIFAAILVIFFDEYGEKDFGVARISCVIFDLDGTLTRTNTLIFASFNHVAQRFLGTTLSHEQIISLFGPPELGGLKNLLGNGRAEAAMEELCSYYRAHHNEMACLHEGIPDALSLLKQRNVRRALFTGKGVRTTHITLEAFGLLPWFDLVVTGDDVVRHKPHGEGITRILHHFALRPGEVLMVGDSLADLSASREAGVGIAAALWDSYDSERVLAAGPDVVFPSVRAMLEWFKLHIGTNGLSDEHATR